MGTNSQTKVRNPMGKCLVVGKNHRAHIMNNQKTVLYK